MSAATILARMAPVYRRDIQMLLSAEDGAHLDTLVRHVTPHGTFRVSDIAVHTTLTQSGASLLAERMRERGVFLVDRVEGRSVYYHLSGDVVIAYGDAS